MAYSRSATVALPLSSKPALVSGASAYGPSPAAAATYAVKRFLRALAVPAAHFASMAISAVIVQELSMVMILPPLAPLISSLAAKYGDLSVALVSCFALLSIAFWGVGWALARPALRRSEDRKIQVGKHVEVSAVVRAIPVVIVNFFLTVTLVPLAYCMLLPSSAFDWKSALPGLRVVTRDVVVWLLLEDLVFFYVHRFAHRNRTIYRLVHKQHHEFTAPISVLAFYCHPLEHIFANLAPMVAGPVLCGSHIGASLAWTVMGVIQGVVAHSGYWGNDDGFHDEHHRSFNVNFGVVGIFDAWHGTISAPPGRR